MKCTSKEIGGKQSFLVALEYPNGWQCPVWVVGRDRVEAERNGQREYDKLGKGLKIVRPIGVV